MDGPSTPRLIPADPAFMTDSEQVVWERLRDTLRPEDTLIANLRLTDEDKDHEADLVVVMPGAGMVVVEVKGGSVRHEGGEWRIRARGQDRRIHPVQQARESMYAVTAYVRSDPRWSRGGIRCAHAVVVPFTDLPADFATPECPRWMIHDRGDLPDLAGRLHALLMVRDGGPPPPSEHDCDLLVDILHGRRGGDLSPEGEAQERESRADRLTQEQAMLLGATRLLHRVEVRGGAGSGKTVLAMTQAKQLTTGGRGQPAQRVALICYSLGLGAYFRRWAETLPRRQRPTFYGTFEELAQRWGIDTGRPRDDRSFWEEELPRLMAHRAAELSPGERFDAIIVDEAQDIADLWWRPLLTALKDPETGGVYVYADENQRIFQRFGSPPVELVPLVLDHNLRNTRQIAETFSSLAPMRMRLRGGDGPQVTMVPSGTGDALDAADDVIDTLLDEGWAPGHLALLTTGRRHPEQRERQQMLGQHGYWQTYWDDEVFYGHVLGCKGLERRAVVLCVNEDGTNDRARERLYVGLSRATDRLVVVGDPAVIEAMGGREVARHLGL